MVTESATQINVKKRQPLVLVEYQRDASFPWMVAGVYTNQIMADKAIKRLKNLMPGSPSFRTR